MGRCGKIVFVEPYKGCVFASIGDRATGDEVAGGSDVEYSRGKGAFPPLDTRGGCPGGARLWPAMGDTLEGIVGVSFCGIGGDWTFGWL